MLERSRFSVNCSILFTEFSFLERPKAAADSGFDAVEFWWPFTSASASTKEVDDFIASLSNANVRLTGLNFFAGDMAVGDRGILSAPHRSSEFDENVGVIADIAARTGCRIFNALYGNRLDGVSPEEQDAVAIERLASLSRFTETTGSQIVLEPLSAVATYPLVLASDALDVIEQLHRGGSTTSVALLADLYHLAVNGDDVSKVIATFGSKIGHVQIADNPGRNEPGTGALPIERWLNELAATGYDGRVGLEYRPSTTSEASFDWI
jgi:hydroxypyruvate isomerase